MADPARAAKRVVLTGPLAKPGFAAETHRKGFAPLSAEHQVRLLAHLRRWMETYSLAVDQLTSDRVDEFLVERRAPYRSLYSRRGLRPLLGFLAGLELLPVEEPVPVTPIDVVAAVFERYLLTERQLLPRTAAAQAARVRRFLVGYCPAGGLEMLTPAEVTPALMDEGRRPGAARAGAT